MPQCYNPSLVADQDTSAFGKNSRYMKATNFNNSTMRRVNVLNTLENKLARMRVNVLERNVELKFRKVDLQRVKILESYKRTLAYRKVLKRHPIRRNPNYQAALNDSYSLHSFRHEIKQMLRDIDPDSVRQKNAKAKVEECKGSYNDIISNNRSKIVEIVPKKPLLPEIEVVPSRSPTPPPQPSIFRRSIAGPPLRGLAKVAQAVTLKMVKEKSWMGTGSPAAKSVTPSNANKTALAPAPAPVPSCSPSMNPHTKLPPIPAAVA